MKPALTILAILVSAGVALAHTGVQNPAVLARMEAMKQTGDAMQVMGDMAKGASRFSAAKARAAAGKVAEQSTRTIALFEAPEDDPNSEALPAIWQDFADFSARADALTTAARAAEAEIETKSDLRAALADLGAACKDCHRRYRE